MLIHIQDDIIRIYRFGLLDILLKDKTTGKNIMWGTDTYAERGKAYERNEEIKEHLISRQNIGIIKTRARKVFEQQSSRTKQHAEVFTPLWVCKKMIDHADEVWFGKSGAFDSANEKVIIPKSKKWQHYVDRRVLEITCGEAPFLVSRYDVATAEIIPIEDRIGILDRKLRIVNENTDTREDWLQWTIRAFQSTYGYEFQGDNLLIARVNFMMSFFEYYERRWKETPLENDYKKIANIVAWNLWQMDGLSGTLPYCKAEEEYQQTDIFSLMGFEDNKQDEQPLCKIYDWRRDNSLTFSNVNKGGRNMKFDFIIGNPPYQDETLGNNKGFAPPIYHKFMDGAFQVADRVELIHPARFLFNAGSTPKEWNQKMLQDTHFKILHYDANSSNVFANTDIKGGVAVSYRDKATSFGAIEHFIIFDELRSILGKVNSTNPKSFSSIITAAESYRFTDALHKQIPAAEEKLSKGHKYDLKTSVLDSLGEIAFHNAKPVDDEYYIQIFGLIKGIRVKRWIKAEYVQGPKNFEKYKIFVPKANGSGALGEVLSTPVIGQPVVGHTQSFISIGSFDTEATAEACLKYIKSKFCRVMLGILKITQDNPAPKWKYVPLQDFTPNSDIDWSKSIPEIDQQLYAKYGLSQEEIDFIETHVKEMS